MTLDEMIAGVAAPDVIADWLEEHGDPRFVLVRGCLTPAAVVHLLCYRIPEELYEQAAFDETIFSADFLWKDIKFFVRCQVRSYHMKFQCYWASDHSGKWELRPQHLVDRPVTLADYEKAEEAASGWIKWDQCSDWDHMDSHFCEKEAVVNFGKMMARMYAIAERLIPSWDDL